MPSITISKRPSMVPSVNTRASLTSLFLILHLPNLSPLAVRQGAAHGQKGTVEDHPGILKCHLARVAISCGILDEHD